MAFKTDEAPRRWRERRRERAARTQDTPEKQAEDRRARPQGDVKDAAARASAGLVANGAAFNG